MIRLAASVEALFLVAHFSNGTVQLHNVTTAVIVALALGIANAVVFYRQKSDMHAFLRLAGVALAKNSRAIAGNEAIPYADNDEVAEMLDLR